MPSTFTSPKTNATYTLGLRASQHGTPEPQIEIVFPKDAHYRQVSAALHTLAADVELASLDNWCVEIQNYGDYSGRVYLELVKATPREVERGMAMLKAVLEGL